MELKKGGEKTDNKMNNDEELAQHEECVKFLTIYFERLMQKILLQKSNVLK